MNRALVLLATAALLLTGCTASTAPTPSPGASAPAAAPMDPAALLAALDLPVLPDAKRALADLEKFVAVAPRRYDNMFEHAAARDWLEAQYEAAGLLVERHKFTGAAQSPNGGTVEGQNIIATLPGRSPDSVIMFGAHYDGAFSGRGAAYDDGSGTLITLELARAMTAYNWSHTLVFASWDQEEAGLVGSAAYARELSGKGREIVLFVNFDMTGINWPAKFLGANPVALTAGFGGDGAEDFVAYWLAAQAKLGYPAEATRAMTGLAASSSDHASFLKNGFPAAWVRGAVIGNYPMYHTADTVETMIADVGGKREDLEGGFNTVLQLCFLLAFLLDGRPVESA